MNKWNMILAVLLVIQGILILVVASPFGGAETPTVERSRLLDGVNASDVLRMRITDGDGKSVELGKSDGAWVLASAGDYPVREDKVEPVLEKLLEVKVGRPVTTKSKNYTKLEVSEETFERKLELFGDADRELGVLYVGSASNYNLRNVRVGGQDSVFVAADVSPWELAVAATQWVDTKWFEVETEAITSLAVRHGDVSIAVKQQEDGGWRMTSPEETAVAKDKMDLVLGGLGSLYLSEPVGTNLEDTAYGFDDPTAEVEIVVIRVKEPETDEAVTETETETETETHRIVIGKKLEEESTFYAKRTGSDFVVTISSYTVENKLQRKTEDFLPELEPEPDEGAEEDESGADESGGG